MENYNSLNEAFAQLNRMEPNSKSLKEEYVHWKKGDLITDDMDGIRLNGRFGKWYVFDSTERNGKKYFILEHETYGDEAGWIVVDEEGNEIIETWDDIETALDDADINLAEIEEEIDETPDLNEAISKNYREFTYYPEKLINILEKKDWRYDHSILGFLFSDNSAELKPEEIGVITTCLYTAPDYKTGSNRPLNADRVGEELDLIVGVVDDEHPINLSRPRESTFARKIKIPMTQIIDGTYELDTDMLAHSTSNFDEIVKLYKEAYETVKEVASGRDAKRAESEKEMDVEEIKKSLDAKSTYPGIDQEFLSWCRDHLLEIRIEYNNDTMLNLLKNRFPESNYDFKWAGEERRSWAARVRFDEIDDCPNKQIEKDGRYVDDYVTVDRVELAKALYDNGFDFGYQPAYGKFNNKKKYNRYR